MTDLEYIAEYKQKCKEVCKKFDYISSIVERNKNGDCSVYLPDSIHQKLLKELKSLDDELILKLEKYYEEFIKPNEEKKEKTKNDKYYEDNYEDPIKPKPNVKKVEEKEKSFWEKSFEEENYEEE